MEEITSKDIRRLLKTFGVKADEAIQSYLEQNPRGIPLKLRITLEDLTDYKGNAPKGRLNFSVEDEIHRDTE